MFHVLVIEDHPLVADATVDLVRRLEPTASVNAVGSALEARNALRQEFDWAAILVDLGVPGAQGFSLAREVSAQGFAHRACVVTAAQKPAFLREAREMGFIGFIDKSVPVETFKAALRRVLRGEPSYPEDFEKQCEALPSLTRQQQRIVSLIGEGLLSKQIAHRLGITEGTVNNHVAAIIHAMGVGTRMHAFQRAVELGLVDPPSSR